MNRRRIRRQLHRGIGNRRFLTIVLPREVVPPQPDISAFLAYAGKNLFDSNDTWGRDFSNGELTCCLGSNTMGGRYPEDDGMRTPFNICKNDYGWCWDEISARYEPKAGKYKSFWFRLPDAWIQDLTAYCQWHKKVHYPYKYEGENPILEVFFHYWAAKGCYVQVFEDRVEVIYSVKPWCLRDFVESDVNMVLNALDKFKRQGKLAWYRIRR